MPVRLDGAPLEPVALIERLGEAAARHGVGRGMHVGDTILGIKGRVAFEAPAAVTLIAAHRELEKLVLSRQQLFWKATLGDLYGAMLHEARFFDPLMRNLEAFLASSQRCVSGSATVRLFQGQATVEGAASPYSLMDRDVALYGEQSSLWSGEEAAAFSKLYGLADALFHRAAAEGRRQCDCGLTRSPRPRGTSPLRREIRVVPEIDGRRGLHRRGPGVRRKKRLQPARRRARADGHAARRRRDRGRAGPSQRPARIFRRRARSGHGRRAAASPESRRRDRAMHLGQHRRRPAAGRRDSRRGADVPRFREPLRRAGAHPHERHSLLARQSAERAGGLRRRHVHEQRQDQRGLPAGAATGHAGQGRGRLQAHRRLAAPRHAANERLRREVGRLVHRRRHRLDQRRKRRSRSRTA